jgi:NADPH2:quinone reductase
VIFENGPPDVLRYEDVPDPACPDGCVLIEVEAISIEGGDLLARAGSPPPATPHIVGYLCAGTVIEVGAGVESPAVGEKVVALNADGSHAEKRAVPAVMTWAIPAGLDPAVRPASRLRSAPRRSASSRPRASSRGRRR